MNQSECLTVQQIQAEAESLGFFLCGVSKPDPTPFFDHFQNWVGRGLHAGMSYLARPDTLARRANPQEMLPGACTLISLAIPYPPASQAPDSPIPSGGGRVASYAWGLDYHDILPPLLEQLVEKLGEIGKPFRYKIFTDSAPLLERGFAAKAGLGWIGKNSCLIHPRLGSYFLLAEILMDLDLKLVSPVITDHCGTCTRCLDACPTGCIRADRTLDSARCISYLTIENKTAIPANLQPLLGDWVFGCDICQEVCPWNQAFAPLALSNPFQSHPSGAWVDLAQELQQPERVFVEKYQGRPIARTRHTGWLRNCLVAAGNCSSPALQPLLVDHLLHNSVPMLRIQAGQALHRHPSPQAVELLSQALAAEPDAEVQLALQNLLNALSG